MRMGQGAKRLYFRSVQHLLCLLASLFALRSSLVALRRRFVSGTSVRTEPCSPFNLFLAPRFARRRAAVQSTFKYTPRLFKTPMRESTVQQERDFVAKNRPHLRTHGLINKDALDASDTDPQWLKGKGDDMFRGGDYRGAINAYSSAFEADGTSVVCVSNRASCYLKLNEPARALSDLNEAMEVSSKEGVDIKGGKVRTGLRARSEAATVPLYSNVPVDHASNAISTSYFATRFARRRARSG